jgi:hypothetical protein
VRDARTGQDGRETINSEVHTVFRKKTRGEVISAELQEGFSHLGTAVTEAGRAVAEELVPRVEAAREVAGPRIEAAQKAAQKAVAPRVAAAVAAATPVVTTARENLSPRVDAAWEVLAPRVDAAWEVAAPRMEAARAAAARAAADLAPRVEAAREALERDVVPRLAATQAAALAYTTPRVLAARGAMGPVFENARESLVTGVETALSELETVREELAASTAEARKKAKKKAAKKRKQLDNQRKQLEKKAGRTAIKLKRKVGVEPEPARWPWVVAALAVAGIAVVLLRRLKGSDDSWTPAPAGDGPVPSYREDPVTHISDDPGKNVSSAETAPNDATPPDGDLGTQINQPVAPGEEPRGDVPQGGSARPSDPALSATTAGPDNPVPEGAGGVDPRTDATNTTDSPRGPAGTPLASRGEQPERLNPQDPAGSGQLIAPGSTAALAGATCSRGYRGDHD